MQACDNDIINMDTFWEALAPLLAEIKIQEEKIRKLEKMVLSLRNERRELQQWFSSLTDHISAFSVFTSPDYIAEIAYSAEKPVLHCQLIP